MAHIPMKVDLTNLGAFDASLTSEINLLIKRKLPFAVPAIYTGMAVILSDALTNSPEYQALQPGGELYGSLGVTFAQEAVAQMIQAIQSDMKITVQENILQLSLFKNNYSTLLTTPLASFISENGQRVDWLEWLLTAGTETVITDYMFAPGIFKSSRTGQGLMIKLGQGKTRRVRQNNINTLSLQNKGFSVPSSYAGDATDNWITRSLEAVQDRIYALIETESFKALSR